MLEIFLIHKYRITPWNSSWKRFQFCSHWSPTATDWRSRHLLYVARTTTAISAKEQHKESDGTHEWVGESERVMNCDTRWEWEVSYILRRSARGSHVRPICSTWYTYSFSLRISRSRKHFETKCLTVYTRVLWKVLDPTMKNQIYNFKIIFIFQHNLP